MLKEQLGAPQKPGPRGACQRPAQSGSAKNQRGAASDPPEQGRSKPQTCLLLCHIQFTSIKTLSQLVSLASSQQRSLLPRHPDSTGTLDWEDAGPPAPSRPASQGLLSQKPASSFC